VPHMRYQRLGRRIKKPQKTACFPGFSCAPPAGVALSKNPANQANFLNDPVRSAMRAEIEAVVAAWERLSADQRQAILKICRQR
jgi:hypothetical protein